MQESEHQTTGQEISETRKNPIHKMPQTFVIKLTVHTSCEKIRSLQIPSKYFFAKKFNRSC